MQAAQWIGKHGSAICKLSINLFNGIAEPGDVGWHAYDGGAVALLASFQACRILNYRALDSS